MEDSEDADAKDRVGEGLRSGEEEREFVPKSLPERTKCSMSASIV